MALGGQVTYYMILSFFPLLIFLLTLMSYVNLSSEHLFADLKYLLPEETYLLVEGIIYEVFAKRSPTLLSFGMLGAVWASLNGINALMRGIVKAYGLTEERPFWKVKLTVFAFLFVVTITFILSIIILFWSESLSNHLFQIFGIYSLFPYLWPKFRLLIQFVLLILTFIILNQMATAARLTIRTVLPGSLLAAGGWIVLSLAFSYYVKHFNNFSVTYGSIGGVIILLLWLYWSTEVLLLSCALNTLLFELKQKSTLGDKSH
ncbi:MAG TPA: YihY/virulence factor BrkB family protein [Peptococcaceae bacterium]|nr:YihY/virulence factor BrkB family protein [Peptococcaceae bacterium]